MAMSSLRLRRALSVSSSFLKHQRLSYSVYTTSGSPSLSAELQSPKLDLTQPQTKSFYSQSRNFRSTSVSLSSSRRPSYNDNTDEEIGPDTILFEGCDYNHWLITMDFPKDPAPTREEKIETYLQTLAKVVGSYEEAKKKMYAFSTTTYEGFQCLVTEEESDKFKGLPGVVFILPDSYIDPVNKEYGGDKYENGVITPRPPPVQYGRSGGRFDRNRDFNRNNTRGPSGDGYRRDSMPMNNAPGGRGPVPSYQNEQRFNNPQSGSFPPGQRDIRGDNRNYGPPPQGPGGNIGQPAGNYVQGPGGNFPQGQSNVRENSMNYGPPQGPGGNFPQGQSNIRGNSMNYGPPQGPGGNIGQPGGNFSQGQSNIRGDGMNYGPPQGAGGNIRQPAGSFGQGPRGDFPQGQGNTRDSMSYAPPPHPGGNFGQGVRGSFPQGQTDVRGDSSAFGHPQGGGGGYQGQPVENFGHQVGRGGDGNFPPEQRGLRGDHMSYGHPQGLGAPTQSQVGTGYGQNYPGNGPDRRFQQAAEQGNDTQGEQRMAYSRTDQVRY